MLWKASDKTPALAIFQGPNAYIHPGWYPSKQRDARVVPTWNYIAVHAHGALTPVEDQAWLRQHLEELTARNETHRAQPWSVSDAPADYVHRRMQAIVGLQLHVSAIEGNWKMAQKQPLENRLGAADGLSSSGDPQNAAVANIMNDLYGGEAS
jgi:transcriptional regulator